MKEDFLLQNLLDALGDVFHASMWAESEEPDMVEPLAKMEEQLENFIAQRRQTLKTRFDQEKNS